MHRTLLMLSKRNSKQIAQYEKLGRPSVKEKSQEKYYVFELVKNK